MYDFLCAGAANIDRKFLLNDDPALGTSNPCSLSESSGGVGRNITENLARLGHSICFIGAVGKDAAGTAIKDELIELGVNTDHMPVVSGEVTSCYTAILKRDGDMWAAFSAMKISELPDVSYLQSKSELMKSCRVWLADLNLSRDAVELLLERSRSDKISLCISGVSVAKIANLPQDLNGLFLLYVNIREAEEIMTREGKKHFDDVLSSAEWLCGLGIRHVVITSGGKGVSFASLLSGKIVSGQLPTRAISLTDATGAGDAGFAGICSGLLSNPDDLEGACRKGMFMSSLALLSSRSVNPDINPETLKNISDL